ncbi:transketolase family protein [Candidatus Micrarchaeota archaeon]|nr:transketolase family protein [Candidatus Micrarchaeota archaeon]
MAVPLNENMWDPDTLERKPSRDGFGKGLVALGEKNPDVYVLCCDLTDSTRASWFKEKFPERFIQVGVAEQNMAGIAAGMALEGKIPFIASYAVFSPGRNWDQLRVSVCYSNANVKIAGCHAGISVGPDGATHQALEDIAIARVLPRMTVLVPSDWLEAQKATIACGEMNGPAYFRFGRENVNTITVEDTPFRVGKAETFYDGSDVTIVANGLMVYESLMAAKQLEKENISARVINLHTVKPIDREALEKAARETGGIVVAEEHQVQAGTGSAVAEVVSETYPVPMRYVGMPDRFGESGQPKELLQKFGMTASQIALKATDVLKLKK